MTADELLAMPDDGFRYELVRGELRKMSPAGRFHGKYALKIGISLGGHVVANDLGEAHGVDTGFILETDPDHVRAPDFSFVRKERADALGNEYMEGFFPGHPDLVVEVISPRDRYREVDEKTADWFAAGTLVVIVANPRNKTVRIHRPHGDVVVLSEDDVLEIPDMIPGWRMPVADIFR